ncbi:MAG: GNAT family N-acetyltransferase [Pseudomonadota bacterium]
MNAPTLHTERLTLRMPVLSDFDVYADIMAADEPGYMGGPFSREAAWGDFCEGIACWSLRGHGTWSAEETQARSLLGFVGLNLEYADPERELGWMFTPHARGKGYAAEAATAIRDYAFETLGWSDIVSYIDPKNLKSRALAERLGAQIDPNAPLPAGESSDDTIVYRHRREAA